MAMGRQRQATSSSTDEDSWPSVEKEQHQELKKGSVDREQVRAN